MTNIKAIKENFKELSEKELLDLQGGGGGFINMVKEIFTIFNPK